MLINSYFFLIKFQYITILTRWAASIQGTGNAAPHVLHL